MEIIICKGFLVAPPIFKYCNPSTKGLYLVFEMINRLAEAFVYSIIMLFNSVKEILKETPEVKQQNCDDSILWKECFDFLICKFKFNFLLTSLNFRCILNYENVNYYYLLGLSLYHAYYFFKQFSSKEVRYVVFQELCNILITLLEKLFIEHISDKLSSH